MAVASLSKKKSGAIFKSRSKNRFRGQSGPGGVKIARGVGSAMFMAIIIGIGVGVLALLSLGAYAGYRWMTAIPYFELREVEITGNHRLSDGDILAAADITAGLNTLGINIRKVESGLTHQPWVSSAAVERVLPGKLRIQIKEKDAWFWVRKDGNLFYADSDGKIIAPVEPGKFVSLPVLYLENDNNVELPAFKDWVKFMDRRALPVAFGELAWVRFGPRNGLEMYIEDKDLHIFITDVNAFGKCLDNANRVWADLDRRGELASGMSIRAAVDRVWVEKKTLTQQG